MATLTPVDHDPFASAAPSGAVTLTPVDHNPFEDAKPLTIKGDAPPQPVTPDMVSSDGQNANGEQPGDVKTDGFNFSRANELTGRAVLEGAAGGIMGLPALAEDAGTNALFGAKKLLAKTGLVSAPDPANYYPGTSSDTGVGSYFPFSQAAGKLAHAIPDKLGLRVPVREGDKLGSAVVRGAASAGTGIGLGGALVRAGAAAPGIASTVATRLGSFLSEAPVAQTASSIAGDTASTGVQDMGGTGTAATVAGLAAGALAPGAAAAGRILRDNARTNILRPRGLDNAAAQVVQDTATNPAAAAARIAAEPEHIPGAVPSGIAASNDPGLLGIDKFLSARDPNNEARIAANNQAVNDHLARAGIGGDLANQAEDTLRRRAGTLAESDKARVFSRATSAPVDITPLWQHLGGLIDPNNPQATQAVSGMAAHARQQITRGGTAIRGPAPRPGVQGPIIGYENTPENLYRARGDILDPSSASGGDPQTLKASVKNSRRQLYGDDGVITQLDDHIASGAPEYPAYMERQRNLRNKVDQLNYGNTLFDKSVGSYNSGDDVPIISAAKLGQNLRPERLDQVLAKGNRMTYEGLSAKKQRNLQNVKDHYAREQRPTRSSQSKTADQTAFEDRIAARARANLPVFNKAVGALGRAAQVAIPLGIGGLGVKAIGGVSGGALGVGLTSGAGMAARAAKEAGSNAERALLDRVARARGNPAELRRLLELGVVQRPGRRAYGRLLMDPARQAIRGGGALGAN